jgi:hypothetical protein
MKRKRKESGQEVTISKLFKKFHRSPYSQYIDGIFTKMIRSLNAKKRNSENVKIYYCKIYKNDFIDENTILNKHTIRHQ